MSGRVRFDYIDENSMPPPVDHHPGRISSHHWHIYGSRVKFHLLLQIIAIFTRQFSNIWHLKHITITYRTSVTVSKERYNQNFGLRTPTTVTGLAKFTVYFQTNG